LDSGSKERGGCPRRVSVIPNACLRKDLMLGTTFPSATSSAVTSISCPKTLCRITKTQSSFRGLLFGFSPESSDTALAEVSGNIQQGSMVQIKASAVPKGQLLKVPFTGSA
jgi:hypothetical protein